jgi:ATP synthase F1 gamma subunit
VSAKKLKLKLASYIKFKELAKSIKMVALSQLSGLKLKISSRGIALSPLLPFFDKQLLHSTSESATIVSIGIDKSCCGPHNSNVFKKTMQLLERLRESVKRVRVFTISNRAKDFFKKNVPVLFTGNIYNVDKRPTSLTVSASIVEKLLSHRSDRYYLVFNRYHTPFIQTTTIYELLGAAAFAEVCIDPLHSKKDFVAETFFSFVHESSDKEVNAVVSEIYKNAFSMFILDALEENEYSSLGARVTAMDNSTTNATKMIEVMGLRYNKARQAAITNELIEIVSAANFV